MSEVTATQSKDRVIEEVTEVEAGAEVAETIEATVEGDVSEKILHTLQTYPYLSRAMIQVALGPALPPKLWAPILGDLLRTNQICYVKETVEAPSGRSLVKGIYHLPSFPYPPVNSVTMAQALAL